MFLLDAYKFIITILNGLSISFYRLIVGFVCLIIGLTRFDKKLMPSWINKIVKIDSMFNSFESFIEISYYFLNPIKESFINFILERPSGKSMTKAQKIMWKIHFIKRLSINHKKVCKKKELFTLSYYQKGSTRK